MMGIQDSSVLAHEAIKPSKESQHKRIMKVCNEWALTFTYFTRKMISQATNIPMHVAAPRVLELIEAGKLIQDFDELDKPIKILCPVSKKRVNALKVNKAKPSPKEQQSLFGEVLH